MLEKLIQGEFDFSVKIDGFVTDLSLGRNMEHVLFYMAANGYQISGFGPTVTN